MTSVNENPWTIDVNTTGGGVCSKCGHSDRNHKMWSGVYSCLLNGCKCKTEEKETKQ